MLFQVAPFVHPDTFHFEMVLIPESLMVSAAILAMALVVKGALDPDPPTVRLGVVSGLIFAFGFSSKYLFLPLAIRSTWSETNGHSGRRWLPARLGSLHLICS
jgi:hypothetical protein